MDALAAGFLRTARRLRGGVVSLCVVVGELAVVLGVLVGAELEREGRLAARLHAGGKDADRTAILDALRVLIVAQILFALAMVLCAISLAPDALI